MNASLLLPIASLMQKIQSVAAEAQEGEPRYVLHKMLILHLYFVLQHDHVF